MSDIHEFAGSYALNALDAAELAEFEAHLATCEICQDEVADFCETAAELSLLSLAPPPPSLRDNIMAAIQNTPQLSAQEADVDPGHTAANGSRPTEQALHVVR